MPPVFLYNFERATCRAPLVSPDELYCSSLAYEPDPHGFRTPAGRFDAAAFVRSLPAPWNNPSLLVVRYDIWHKSIAANLREVKCPKILMLPDTHHMQNPILRALKYIQSEPFDAVCSHFNRQHLHFLHEAGVRNPVWLPSFEYMANEASPQPNPHPVVAFRGRSHMHPYRRHILEMFGSTGVPLDNGHEEHALLARTYANSLINLNVSLNADFNQRVFEVLAAGGFLLTDRLAPESGLEVFFQNGRHLVTFDSPTHLFELIWHYLSHPQEAMAIAATGHAEYLEHHRPEHKVRDLLAIVEDSAPDHLLPKHDKRTRLPKQDAAPLSQRIVVYECLQSAHQLNYSPQVLFWPGLEREASDAIDLPRLKISVLRTESTDPENALSACGLQERVQWLAASKIDFRSFRAFIVLCQAKDFSDPLLHQWIQCKAGDVLVLARPPRADEMPAVQTVLDRFRPKVLNRNPETGQPISFLFK